MTSRLPRLLALLVLLPVRLAEAAPPLPPADWLLEQVKLLSAPEMEGRASGTAGAERAARHIADVFKQAGLAPGGDKGSFFQSFEVVTRLRPGPTTSLTLLSPTRRAFSPPREFTPLAGSTEGSAEGEVVFVGYGITAPELHYDDYAGLDARGKIVLAMTHAPGENDPANPFRTPEASRHREPRQKIINAREHGARAIILVTSPTDDRGELPPLGRAGRSMGIQAVHVTRAVADTLLEPSGRRLADLQQVIDRSLGSQSFHLPGVMAKLEVSLIRERGTAQNVVGILRGTDPKQRDEAIVIGAHYDHLGRGSDATGQIYPGADDNASGSAGLMALARALVTAGGLPRTAIFAAFAGEEMGLLGSSHYVKQPPVPLEQTVFMLNMDMIGRLRGGRLHVSGVESGAELRLLVKESATGLPLDLRLRGDPFGPSDHSPFYSRELPVLLLTTGVHADYHKPTDSWEKIDPQGMEVVLTFASRLIAALGAQTPPPVYVKLSPPSGRGSGTFFGVTFDGAEEDRPGVKLGGIAAGSPADRAGVKPGDLIVKFAGVPVTAPDDLIVAVRARRPGETVEVVLFRDGTEHRLAATLGDRR